jgi:hypothetical protein
MKKMPEDLTEAEEHLIACAAKGESAIFYNSEEIRAEVIVALADSERDKEKYPVDTKGVMLSGAKIIGKLDFEGMTLNRPLVLDECEVNEDIVLRDARTNVISFQHLKIRAAINGDRMTIDGSFFLRKSIFYKEVRLLRAEIGGDLSCTGATFVVEDGNAISCD